MQLKPGDCFLLPRGGPFRLASELSLASVDAATLFATTKNGTIASLNGGGDCFIVGAHFALAGNHAIIQCRKDLLGTRSGQRKWSVRFGHTYPFYFPPDQDRERMC